MGVCSLEITKGVNIVCGHYGSGKTNFAVNLAIRSKTAYPESDVYIADLDIVNPYFRTADAEEILRSHGIIPAIPVYANSNVDIPVLPPQMTRMIESKTAVSIIDVGGDDGAVALGMYRDMIKAAGYEMYFVVNMYRPLIADPSDAAGCMREIEAVSGLKCTKLINNSSLGAETTVKDVLDSVEYAHECEKACGIPLAAHLYCGEYVPKIPHVDGEEFVCITNATKKLF